MIKRSIQAKKIIELFPEEAARDTFFLYNIYLGKGMEPEAMEQRWIMLEKCGASEAEIQEAKDNYKKRRSRWSAAGTFGTSIGWDKDQIGER